MRTVRLLIIVLLLAGFASRPSVVAAMSSGQVLIEVAGETVSVSHGAAEVQPGSASEIRIAIAKCVSLGILPTPQTTASNPPAITPHSLLVAELRQDRAFIVLRPPQA
jgi:hypothetical protein